MNILVDADGSRRIDLVEKVASRFGIPVILFCDESRELQSTYSQVVYCAVANDSADIALFNHCKKGDIVVTRDIGLAGITLGKGARVIHESGRIMNNKTIDRELGRRAVLQKMRRNTKHAAKANKVRFEAGKEPKYNFYGNLVMLLKQSTKAQKSSEADHENLAENPHMEAQAV